MGKTGLILRLFDELKDVRPDIHTIYVDIFASRHIDDFIKLMAEASMKSFKTKTSVGEKLLTFILEEKERTEHFFYYHWSIQKKRFIGCNVVTSPFVAGRCYNVTTYIQENCIQKNSKAPGSLCHSFAIFLS